jgi:ferrochelatase
VRDVLRALPHQDLHDAIVAPIGFLCDHVEVLYDLDVDAAAAAKDAGVRMERAAALNDHPLFIRMLADLVQQCAA